MQAKNIWPKRYKARSIWWHNWHGRESNIHFFFVAVLRKCVSFNSLVSCVDWDYRFRSGMIEKMWEASPVPRWCISYTFGVTSRHSACTCHDIRRVCYTIGVYIQNLKLKLLNWTFFKIQIVHRMAPDFPSLNLFSKVQYLIGFRILGRYS